MIGKFFIAFVIVFAYMVVPAVILMSLGSVIPTEIMLGAVIAITIGLFPLMIWISKRILLFRAKNTDPIEKDKLIKIISDLDVKDCHFTVEFRKDFMVLTPPYLNAHFMSLYSSEKYKTSYYMKLWFNEKTNTVRFKDHLVTTSSVLGIDNFSFNFSAQSGFVSTQVHLLDSHGKLVHFSNAELHKQLIKAVTENGWNLSVKMF